MEAVFSRGSTPTLGNGGKVPKDRCDVVDCCGVTLFESRVSQGTEWSFVPIKLLSELLKQLSNLLYTGSAFRVCLGMYRTCLHVGPFSYGKCLWGELWLKHTRFLQLLFASFGEIRLHVHVYNL